MRDIEKLDAWRKKSIFTAPSYDFEPSNSSDLHGWEDKMRDIEQDRAMCQRATPGPWYREKTGANFNGFSLECVIADTAPGCTGNKVYAQPEGGSFPRNDANFIAEARTALPYYIERTAHLEKDLALNGSMLAKQSDMAREAETRQMLAENRLKEALARTEIAEKRVAKLEATLQEATRILRSIVTHRIILRMCKGCDEFPCQGDIRVICIFQKLMSDIDTYLCKAKEDDTK